MPSPVAGPGGYPTSPQQPAPTLRCTLDDLVERARGLIATPGKRTMLGLTGAPGAGKSTVAEALAARLGSDVAVVGLDGFHLADSTLDRWGRRDRKGAPDTFDVHGYVALLARLRRGDEDVVHAPFFDRVTDAALASAVPVPREVPLVVTEGNYLLLNQPGWREVRGLLDQVWYLTTDEELRLQRLVERHATHGKPAAEARAWATGPDQRNAALIEATRSRADLVVELHS